MPKRVRDSMGNVAVNMNTKTAKYFVAHHMDGLSKSAAARVAGISTVRNVANIEKTETYQTLARRYAGVIERTISIDDVAEEHKKNIIQDQDRGAKNKAIEMYLNRVEPEEKAKDDDDRMIVVMRG